MANHKGKMRSRKSDREMGRRIQSFRKQKGLTQSALGAMLGVTFQQVQKYENGANSISSTRIPLLCRALEILPNDLFGF